MRGFFLGALVLVGLDVALNAPVTRVTAFLATPTRWLAQWMDARTPLISAPVPAGSAGSSGDAPPPFGALPGGSNPGQQMKNGETFWKTHGQPNNCPPGFPPNITCEAM